MPALTRQEIDEYLRGSASNARLNPQNAKQAVGEAVGQVRKERRRTKDESERLIKEFLLGQTDSVVFLDICDHLNRRPSPILRQILEEMVGRGEVIVTQDFGAGPLIARNLYRVNR